MINHKYKCIFVEVPKTGKLEFHNNKFRIITKATTNTIPNTMMTKRARLLRKNTQKTLSISGTNLENSK